MRITTKLAILTATIGLLASCKPGPVYLGSEPVVIKDSQGNAHRVQYKIHKKRIVTVPSQATGSDLITDKIRAEFAQDPVLSPYNIDVQTNHHEVTLTGQVPDKATQNYAIKMARYNKGVLMVHDNLAISKK